MPRPIPSAASAAFVCFVGLATAVPGQDPCGVATPTSIPTNPVHKCLGDPAIPPAAPFSDGWVYHLNPLAADPTPDTFLLAAGATGTGAFRDVLSGGVWHIEAQITGGPAGNPAGTLEIKVTYGSSPAVTARTWKVAYPALAAGASHFVTHGVPVGLPDREIRWAEYPETGPWTVTYSNLTASAIRLDAGICEIYCVPPSTTDPHRCAGETSQTTLAPPSLSIEINTTHLPLIVTEANTGTPDFVEIANRGSFPVPLAGVSIFTSNNAVCPSSDPANNGLYTLAGSGATAVPGSLLPGEHYLIREFGAAGAPTAGPANGEHTGKSINWAAGSHGEIALLGPGGVPLDYVCFQYTGGNAQADDFRNNPAGLAWLTGPVLRTGAAFDSVRRLLCGSAYCDFDLSADWNAEAGAGTPGLPNPAGGVLTCMVPGVDLEISAPSPGTVAIRVVTGHPSVSGAPVSGGGYLAILYSLAPLLCAGGGPVFGLVADVIPQFAYAFPPFQSPLDYAGTFAFMLSGVPPGISVEARAIVFPSSPSTALCGALQSTAFSNFVYFTTP